MKICPKCKINKPLDGFAKSSKRKDGLQYKCRECHAKEYIQKIDHIKIRQKAWYQANIEALSKKWRAYGIENREKINQKSRAWYAANKDRVSENGRAWRSANREARAASCRNRRRMKYSADGKHTAFEVLSIFEHQRGLCAACNCKLLKSGRERFHVDHITPLLRGGSNDKYNLQCLCPFCNLSKGAKDPIQWAEQNGRLL